MTALGVKLLLFTGAILGMCTLSQTMPIESWESRENERASQKYDGVSQEYERASREYDNMAVVQGPNKFSP